MANFGTRLDEFGRSKGFKSQEDFAQSFGMTQKNITSWIAGSVPSPKNLDKITKAYPELNRDWLLYGTGSMILEKSAKELELMRKIEAVVKEKEYWKAKYMEEVENKFKQ